MASDHTGTADPRESMHSTTCPCHTTVLQQYSALNIHILLVQPRFQAERSDVRGQADYSSQEPHVTLRQQA